jgi:hypothetical protein
MILSNEPGYYRDGAFGIRIENLVHVCEAPALDGADDRDMLAFRTLTWAPIDRRLIDTAALTPQERGWLDDYHAQSASASRRVWTPMCRTGSITRRPRCDRLRGVAGDGRAGRIGG